MTKRRWMFAQFSMLYLRSCLGLWVKGNIVVLVGRIHRMGSPELLRLRMLAKEALPVGLAHLTGMTSRKLGLWKQYSQPSPQGTKNWGWTRTQGSEIPQREGGVSIPLHLSVWEPSLPYSVGLSLINAQCEKQHHFAASVFQFHQCFHMLKICQKFKWQLSKQSFSEKFKEKSQEEPRTLFSQDVPSRFSFCLHFPSAKLSMAFSTSLGNGGLETHSLYLPFSFLKRCMSFQSNQATLLSMYVPSVLHYRWL